MIALPASILALLNPLDIAAFVATLPAKIEKDELRLRLFGMACAKKTAELTLAAVHNATNPASALDPELTKLSGGVPQEPAIVTADVSGTQVAVTMDLVRQFGLDAADVLAEYEHDAERLAPRKWSLGSIVGHGDAFAPGREKVREFAAKWDLDAAFREAMG